MIVRLFPFLSVIPNLPLIYLRHDANYVFFVIIRSNRQRLRALQIRGLRPKGLRRSQLPLVRRPPYLLRALARDRLPGSVLPAK